ncbi:hypothetical protein CI105_03850 [Candidatus Izimaplasma bacterium ZiA1]|uniref:hypothetical protein n=1 Tax=Candidatus Izimoplasma sp. ZiA1 TaxID=2024899 RepID=UPI000BAA6626|nr:hypothetical protein CI105_03850 [Candidatus Izimaplasma bacterium ZiA1]
MERKSRKQFLLIVVEIILTLIIMTVAFSLAPGIPILAAILIIINIIYLIFEAFRHFILFFKHVGNSEKDKFEILYFINMLIAIFIGIIFILFYLSILLGVMIILLPFLG